MKVVVSMKRFQFVFTIMSMEKVQYSLLAEGEDCLLSKLCWDIIFKPSDGLKSGVRYTLKQGQELPYAPPLREG